MRSNALVQSCSTGRVILRIWQCSSAHLHQGFLFATIAYLFNRTSGNGTRLSAGSVLLKSNKPFQQIPPELRTLTL